MSSRLHSLDEEIAELKANFANKLAQLEDRRPQLIAEAIAEEEAKAAATAARVAALRASLAPAAPAAPTAFLLPAAQLPAAVVVNEASAPPVHPPQAAIELAAKVRWEWEPFVARLGLEADHPIAFKPLGNFFKGKGINVPCRLVFVRDEPSVVSALYKTEIKSLNPTALGSTIKAKMGAPASGSASARGWPSCVGNKEFFINHGGADYPLAHSIWEGLRWDPASKTFVAKDGAAPVAEVAVAQAPKPKRAVNLGTLAWEAFRKHAKATMSERFAGRNEMQVAKEIKEGNMEAYRAFVEQWKAAHPPQ